MVETEASFKRKLFLHSVTNLAVVVEHLHLRFVEYHKRLAIRAIVHKQRLIGNLIKPGFCAVREMIAHRTLKTNITLFDAGVFSDWSRSPYPGVYRSQVFIIRFTQ